jgi:hypothetical protein
MHVSTNQGEVVEGTKYSVEIEVGLSYKLMLIPLKPHQNLSDPLVAKTNPALLLVNLLEPTPHIAR